MKKVLNRKANKFKLIAIAIVLILVICSALAFRYARSLAIGGNLLTSSLIISNYSTSPGAAPSANAIWDSLSYPSGKVHFDVWVRGKKGTINYYFWANCPNYNSSTVYNVASLGAVCGGSNNYTYSAAGWTSMYMNHNFDYNYTSAGQFKPVILVERGGVFIHKGMDIALKPKIDLFVEYSSSSSYTSIQKEADGDYSPTVQMVNTIAYGQYARLKWDVRGVPAGNTCTASSSAGAPVWTGSKALSGVADLGQMTGGSFVYRLTCSYASTTNYDEITLNIPPYVELTGSIPSFTAVTATNSQTVNINSVANPAPLNAGVTLSGYTKGADRCTITSSPAGYVPSPTSYTTAVTSTRIGVFSNKISTGINGTTSFTLACSRTISGVTRSSFATIRVFASTGNCAFKGNNDIQAMTFCKNSLVTLNGGDNIQLKGSFVASNFSIDSDSDNVRFMYDFDTRDKTPPGFNYLNIPSPKEVGNSQ